jgi:hypothetical protein
MRRNQLFLQGDVPEDTSIEQDNRHLSRTALFRNCDHVKVQRRFLLCEFSAILEYQVQQPQAHVEQQDGPVLATPSSSPLQHSAQDAAYPR